MTAVLRISDGTTTISLLGGKDGFYLNRWRPALAPYKGRGTFQSSPLADGRRLVARQFDNAMETFDLKVRSDAGQDNVIYQTQELRRLLEKAVDYWATRWQDEPVWIEAQATCETNARYALIHSYKTPDDENPYAPPFLQLGTVAAMDRWTLILERGHWLADQPETGTCVQASATQDWPSPSDLETDYYVPTESDDDAYAGGGNIWRNTATIVFGQTGAAVSMDCGVRFRSVDIPNAATITRAWVEFTAGSTDAGTTCNADIFGEDVDDAAAFSTFANFAGRVRTAATVAWAALGGWIMGTTYDTPDISAIVQEIVDRDGWASGNDLVIFVEDDASSVGAFREPAAWDNVTYNEPRLYVEWFDEAGGSDYTYGRAATCEDEVYIANKENVAQLTHIYVDNGGAWGPNLLAGNPPYDLLPAVPVANDAVYFGISTALADTGPFCSLVFDLSQAQAAIADLDWEYWNGAWTDIPNIQDNTDADGAMTGAAFDTTGVKSVHWRQPIDWATRDISLDGGPAITGYWVRALVNDAGTQPPIQQTRHVYTITWPYFEVDDAQVAGDLPALIRVRMRNQADNDTLGHEGYATAVLAGLRSNVRGTNFQAFINLANEQNPTGVTVTQAGVGVLTAASVAPTGVLLRITNPGAAWQTDATIAFDDTIIPEYIGEYHGFLRVNQTDGDAGDIQFRIYVDYAVGGTVTAYATTILGPWMLDSTDNWALIDMGKIIIPPTTAVPSDETFEIVISLQAYGDGSCIVDVYDLILIPIDEAAVHMHHGPGGVHIGNRDNPTTDSSYLDMDQISFAKVGLRSFVRNYADDLVMAHYVTRANSEFILQANADQRIYFLNMDDWHGIEPMGYPNNANTVYVIDNERYLSMRGER